MSWTAKSGNVYNLCLLDTNALSEILKHPTVEGRGFLEKYPPSSFAPCFTVYNLIELRYKPDLFEQFINFFALYPCCILKNYILLYEDEKQAYNNPSPISPWLYTFSQVENGGNLSEFVEKLFQDPETASLEKTWTQVTTDIMQTWLSLKNNFVPKKQVPNALDADTYVAEAGLQYLIKMDMGWAKKEIDKGKAPDINRFPSLKTMFYSQYYRIFRPPKKQTHQEVTDVLIMAVAPYMDVVITEKYQAEILNQIKNKVQGLNNVDIAVLENIRYKPDIKND